MENLEGRSLRDITCKKMIDWYGIDEQLNGVGRKLFKVRREKNRHAISVYQKDSKTIVKCLYLLFCLEVTL